MNSLTIFVINFKVSFCATANVAANGATATRLLPFIGNTIRGALGQALYNHDRDTFDAVFKVDNDISAPNAFSLSVPYPSKGSYDAGDAFVFQVRLFGKAGAYSKNIIKAASAMNMGKLANAKIDFMHMDRYDWADEMQASAPVCEAIKLDFITPTELISGKRPVRTPEFPFFVDILFGRISDICEYYGDREFIIPYALVARKPLISAEYFNKPVEINSNKQPIRGFTGRIHYYGDLTRYAPYFALGSMLNIGKKTTRSCGEYRIALE